MPDQFILFIEAAALGFLLGAYYDIFRAFRACCHIRKTGPVFFTDILFWVTATVFCLWFIFYYRWGEIYSYTYLGLAVGGGAYFFGASVYLYRFWYRFFAGIRKGVKFVQGLSRRALDRIVNPARRLRLIIEENNKRIKNVGPIRRIIKHIYRN